MLVIVGPTGIGKTEIALAVARHIPCEIVVVDSMQVYRGMDVGTGKPPHWMRQEVPHHGIDLAEPEEEFDVARYVQTVRPVLEAIQEQGRIPLLVGGSGLYHRALVDGICRAPGQDSALRAHLIAREHDGGPGTLHAQLRQVDPECAERIHPNDLRRIVRALEVYRLTGKPLSDWQKNTTQALREEQGMRVWGLMCDRDRLYRQIEARIDGWLAGGWLEEARVLSGRALGRTAREALGYQELFEYFQGRRRWDDTRRLIHRNTRRYAKRQLAWFRADARVRWIGMDKIPAEAVARRIMENAGN